MCLSHERRLEASEITAYKVVRMDGDIMKNVSHLNDCTYVKGLNMAHDYGFHAFKTMEDAKLFKSTLETRLLDTYSKIYKVKKEDLKWEIKTVKLSCNLMEGFALRVWEDFEDRMSPFNNETINENQYNAVRGTVMEI